MRGALLGATLTAAIAGAVTVWNRDAPASAAARGAPPNDEAAARVHLSTIHNVEDPAGANLHKVQSLLNVRRQLQHGDFIWSAASVPPGPVWVRVDLSRQLISVFMGGHEIGTAVIVYGAKEKATPKGKFPIITKLEEHRSSLYGAEMPYTLRLTGDGIAIHGSKVSSGAATHGCIGVPTDFAALLFDQVSVGDEVVIL